MKAARLRLIVIVSLFLLVAVRVHNAYGQPPSEASPVGTAFTYQGRLEKTDGSLEPGPCDLRFSLWDGESQRPPPIGPAQVGTTLNIPNQQLSEGLFTVHLDFGDVADFQGHAPFASGEARWLEIELRCQETPPDIGNFTKVSPRQPLTPSPFALFSRNAGSTRALLGRPLISAAPAPNQVLKWNGSGWAPADDAGSGNVSWDSIAGKPSGFADDVDNDTTYSAGAGLTLTGTSFRVDQALVQSRIGATCSPGSAIRGVNENGSVECADIGGGPTPTAAPAGWTLKGNAGTNQDDFIGTTDNKALAFRTNNSERVHISESGSVGIGTSNPDPATALHIKGDRLRLDGNGKWIDLFTGGLGIDLFAVSHALAIRSGGSERCPWGCNNVYINPFAEDGLLGVGTESPAAELHAVSRVGTSNAIIGESLDGIITAGVVGVSTGGGYGVRGVVTNGGLAGKFEGNVAITGSVSKGSGSFKIDHPLDPANKYLYHSFVESPDMMNVYNGNTSLDSSGRAVVVLPTYFQALNQDFRYQLTCIGGFAPIYVAEEIRNNRFVIAGGRPGLKVSWQVTGIRHDPYAKQHRIAVEEVKPAQERGKYLYPLEYGKRATDGIDNATSLTHMGEQDGK